MASGDAHARLQALFFTVKLWRPRQRHTVLTANEGPCSMGSIPASPTRMKSLCAATAARITPLSAFIRSMPRARIRCASSARRRPSFGIDNGPSVIRSRRHVDYLPISRLHFAHIVLRLPSSAPHARPRPCFGVPLAPGTSSSIRTRTGYLKTGEDLVKYSVTSSKTYGVEKRDC